MKKVCGLVKFEDDEHWRKFLATLCVAVGLFNNGWFYGLLGPSLPDLEVLTNTDLQQASHLLVAEAVGRMLGAITIGYACDRTKKPLHMLMLVTGVSGLLAAALPWSHFFGVFLVIATGCGFCTGGVSCSGNAKLASMWGIEGRYYFQFVSFSYAVGGILSPLVGSPFFGEPYIELLDLINSTERPSTISDSLTGSEQDTMRFINASSLTTAKTLGVSHIQYPFGLSGVFFLTASVCILGFLCKHSEHSASHIFKETLTTDSNTDKLQPLSKSLTAIFLFIFFLLSISAASVEFIHQAYLMTFAIRQMKWTRSTGAIMTSVLWAAIGLGRLAGTFVARYFSPTFMIYLSFFGMLLTSFGEFGGGYFRIDSLFWICVSLMGVCMSICSPALIVWVNENLIAVSGKVSSFIIFTMGVAMLTFPLYLGFLIDKVSPMWFVYIQPIESAVSIVLFTVLVLGVKQARRSLHQASSETKPLMEDARVN